MRLSNRLLGNAATTYLRLGTTFFFGIFFTWYAIGRIGMVGLGMIAFAAGAFGLAGAVETALRRSLIREMAASIASGQTQRVRESLTSALALCAPAAAVLMLISTAIAAIAYLGIFKTPADAPELRTALAILLLAEGVHTSVRVICAPYTQALFAAQHVGLDNVVIGIGRATNAVSALVVFGALLPEATLAEQLVGFAAIRAVYQLLLHALGVCLARIKVRGLKFQRSAFSRAEFRSILGTVWHTGQVSLLMDLNVQFTAIVINLFFGMTYNGIWHIVVQLGGYSRVLGQSLLRGVDPLSTHLLEQGRRAAILDLMMRTMRYQLGALLPIVSWLVIFMHPVLYLWVAGRLARDPNFAGAGITIDEAINMIAVMIYLYLVAQVARTSMFGVERMLYGMGEVRSYSWFAKYAALLNVGLAAALMWWFDTPIVAPIALLITYVIYYPGIILLAAARRVGLPLRQMARRSIPRPLIAATLLSIPMVLVRLRIDELTLISLLVLLACVGALHAVLLYAVVFDAGERARIRQLLGGRAARARDKGEIDKCPEFEETAGE